MSMRLLIVSNRLPVTVFDEDGELVLRPSSGGLVSGLGAYLDAIKREGREYVWIGWPGVDLPEQERPALEEKLAREHNARPVFASKRAMDNFYGGFCNSTLWPLFHYFPSYATFEDEDWESYKNVNQRFCDAVLRIARPDDVVWVHDYHLMLLPQMLRQRAPGLSIGFFLHIPFPSFELFRLLPGRWRGELLHGLLGADLVGFHTNDYAQYFLRCVLRILGHEHTLGQVAVKDRLVQCDTFPMGIDYDRYHAAAKSDAVQAEAQSLRATLAGQKLIVSIDRLDYTKGVLNRLQGFERFLRKYPEWRRQVQLLLVVVPSRTEVERYDRMKRRIDELIGKINGEFTVPGWTPIVYQFRSLSLNEIVGVYAAGDVALITPLRDGMNLVAKEYVAARTDGTGVLILSETAGASREMGEAWIITPSTSEEIADALKAALEMPADDQDRRLRAMQERLRAYNVVRWGEDFMNQLAAARAEQARFATRMLRNRPRAALLEAYRNAHRRLLLLDYDGTLVPFEGRPDTARPSHALLAALERLESDPRDEVVVISGRPRDTLDSWLGPVGVSLVAEHGAWVRKGDEPWRLVKPLRTDWKAQILPLLKASADRLPGAFVEEKEYALVWHYREADLELASLREKELVDSLVQLTANLEVTITQGDRIVEVRNAGVSKGSAAVEFLGSGDFDFVIAIGDDATDEDLFKALPESAFTIRVGLAGSRARFNVADHGEVLRLLQDLAETGPAGNAADARHMVQSGE